MQPAKMKRAMVMMVSAIDTGKDPVSGELNLEETTNGIKITGQISGLEPGTVLKGQLISKCPFGVIVWTKMPTKYF